MLTCHLDCRFGSDDYVASMLDLIESHPEAAAITGQPKLPPGERLSFAEKVNVVANLMDVVPPPPGAASSCRSVSRKAAATCSGWRRCARSASTTRGSGSRARTRCWRRACVRRATPSTRRRRSSTSSRCRTSRTASASSCGTSACSAAPRRTFCLPSRAAAGDWSGRRRVPTGRVARSCAPRSSRARPPSRSRRSRSCSGGRRGRGSARSDWCSLQARAPGAPRAAVRFGPGERLAFVALQPALDIAYAAGLVEGLWQLARGGRGPID